MVRFKIIFRLLTLTALFLITLCLGGFWMGSRVGAVLGLSLALFLELAVLILSEKWIINRVYRPKHGDQRIEKSLQVKAAHHLRVYLIDDSVPLFQSVRSLGSRGQIVISSGLLTLLSSSELDLLLRSESKRIRSFYLTVITACLAMSRALDSLVPSKWKKMSTDTLRSPFLALPIFIILSLSQSIQRLAQKVSFLNPSGFSQIMTQKGFNQVFAQSETTSRIDSHTFLSI